MKVWLVFHADIEDDRYVRGVFATKELAEAVVTLDETYPVRTGLDDYFDTRIVVRHHGDYCCGVDEVEVRTAPPETFVLNPQPPYTGPSLIPVDLMGAIEEMLYRPFPAFDRFTRGEAIGKVHSITEDQNGITVEAELE